MPRSPGDLSLGAAARLRVAGIAILVLWAAVLWCWLLEPSVPEPTNTAPAPIALSPVPARDGTSRDIAPRATTGPVRTSGKTSSSALIQVAASGQRTPVGGLFDRFDVAAQPIVAPVNASGQVAFYASISRNKATEGIFLASGGRIEKAAAAGDRLPGGGVLSGFARHPMPALNDTGTVAFGAAVTAANGGEGIFLARDTTLTIVAMSGADAPAVPGGTFVDFDAPALNNNGEVAFVATVRHGRETFQALYLLSNGRLRKLVAEGDPVLGGGTFERFGLPSINNRGVIAFPATMDHGPVLGGIFVTGTRDLKMLVGVGAPAPDGRMMVRLSEHVAIDDDDDIAFGAQLGVGKASVEAVMRANTTGLALIAEAGAPAPGGGTFSGFGPWPSTGPEGRIAFVAAVEGGPGPIGIFTSQGGALLRVVTVGEKLAGGEVVPPFAINSVTSASPNGGVTFATMSDAEAGGNRIYYLGPVTK